MRLRLLLTGLAWCLGLTAWSALVPGEAAAQQPPAPPAPFERTPTTAAEGQQPATAPTRAPPEQAPKITTADEQSVTRKAQSSQPEAPLASDPTPPPSAPDESKPSAAARTPLSAEDSTSDAAPSPEPAVTADAGALRVASSPAAEITEKERDLREQLEQERRLRSELERTLEGERAPNRPPAPGRDVFRAFNDWLWERADAPPPASPPPSTPGAEPPPPTETNELEVYLQQLLREWLGLAPRDRFSWFGLFFLLGLAWLSLRLVQRARQRFSPDGLIPAGLRATTLALRLAVLWILLTLCLRLLPSSLRPGLFVAMVALSVAVGFGTAWWLLPDILSGVLLSVDSRIRRGQWIAGSGFAGRVERIGPTVTRLRTAEGSMLLLPNRLIAKSPIHRGVRHGYFVEVEIQAPADAPSSALREAIRESVLCSPYVPPNPQLSITRHTRDPLRWRIRVRLTNAQFAASFRGELLERVEDALRARARVAS